MLVWINHNRIHVLQKIEYVPRMAVQIFGKTKISAVGRVGMHAKSIPIAQLQNFRERID